MILYGASGHGKVVYDIVQNKVMAFFDDNESINEFLRLPVCPYSKDVLPEDELIITIGDNRTRKNILSFCTHNYGLVISASATISRSVEIGIGSQIVHKSLIQSDSVIGRHVIINSMASIDHDCIIGDFAHIGPNATLCGNVEVGEGTLVGAGSVIIPGTHIGKWSVIAAGSVVTKPIPDYCLAAGNPARIIKYYDKI